MNTINSKLMFLSEGQLKFPLIRENQSLYFLIQIKLKISFLDFQSLFYFFFSNYHFFPFQPNRRKTLPKVGQIHLNPLYYCFSYMVLMFHSTFLYKELDQILYFFFYFVANFYCLNFNLSTLVLSSHSPLTHSAAKIDF